jgi:hypothetical protein
MSRVRKFTEPVQITVRIERELADRAKDLVRNIAVSEKRDLRFNEWLTELVQRAVNGQ